MESPTNIQMDLDDDDDESFDLESDLIASEQQQQQEAEEEEKELMMKTTTLNDETRREAKAAFGKILNEIRCIDSTKHDLIPMTEKLNSCLHHENNCLSRFGINELLPMDAKNMAFVAEQSINVVRKFTIVKKFDKHEFRRQLRKRLLQNCLHTNYFDNIDPMKRIQLIHLYPTGIQFDDHYHYQAPCLMPTFTTDENIIPSTKQRRIQQQEQTRTKLPSGVATQPTQQKQSNDMNNVDESDKRLEYIYKTLKKLEKKSNDGVPFFQAILNPNDFATTIENMFNLAFLARQSRVIINDQNDDYDGGDDDDDNDDGGEPLIFTKERNDENNHNANDGDDDENHLATEMNNKIPMNKEPKQSPLSFDMKTYHQLLDKLSIIRPAIKDQSTTKS